MLQRILCGFAVVLFCGSLLSGKTVWDGVYTTEQAQRGRAAYEQYCVRCHKDDLTGIEGSIKGDAFMERRREDRLDSLFLDMKATMPRGPSAGKLPEDTYADLVAFILQNNGMPSGAAELTPRGMSEIDVVGKEGPQPVPNFAAVLSVGCLTLAGENRWTLVNASEPVRTRDTFQKIDAEIEASRRRDPGPDTYRLADAENFDAAAHTGKKIQVKGILVRAPAGNRINVNSIEPIADTCR